MARLSNARKTHVTRWVIPAATKLLIEGACKDVPTQPLGRVAHIEMGQSPRGDSCNEQGEGVPLVGGPADLGLVFPETSRWTSAPTKLCKSGDIIVCVRATIGEPRWADKSYCLGRGVAAIRPIHKSLDAKFLFRIIEGNEQSLRDQGTGTTFKTIGKQHLSAILVPIIPLEQQKAISAFLEWLQENSDGQLDFSNAPSLPQSLDEQRRIVSRIEELAAKIEEARGLRRQATEEVHVLFDAAMNGIWKDQDNWAARRVEELASIVSGQVDPRIEPYASLPHISGESIESGTCRLLPYQLAKEDGVRSGKFHFKAGSMLYSKIRPYLRKAVEVPCEGVCSADIYAFEGISPELDPRFFMYSLIAPPFTNYANTLSGRTRMPKLNQKQLFAFAMHYPPLLEQKRIVSYLDGLQAKQNSLKELQNETAAELDALLPSILSKAFRGEL